MSVVSKSIILDIYGIR